MNRLFLTGPIGCGKSTAISRELGDSLKAAGGFLTLRQRDASGRVTGFTLEAPDGSRRGVFLDCSVPKAVTHPEVFSVLGAELLHSAVHYPFIVLDEIGGVEVLDDAFMAALEAVLQSDIPCIGVMKGLSPAGKMIRELDLDAQYLQAAEKLRSWMRQDKDTLLYECSQFDPQAAELVRQWKAKYL